jgi:hypothetical protein
MLPASRLLRAVGLFAFLAFAACEDTAEQPKVAQTCSSSGDCGTDLACANGTCHIGCTSTAECASQNGGQCVRAANGVYVCQLPSEQSCARNSDCAGAQICGTDERCADACETAADCVPGQRCNEGLCVSGASTATPSAPACTSVDDCKEGFDCVNRACSLC